MLISPFSAGADDLNWPDYMATQAVKWQEPPTLYTDAPYAGNGVMGVYTWYREDTHELEFVVSRMDAYDLRLGLGTGMSNPYVTARGRLPKGAFRLKLPESVEIGQTVLSFWDGEYRYALDNNGQAGSLTTFIHPNEDILVIQTEGYEWAEGDLQWHPHPSVSLRFPDETPPYPPQYQEERGGVSVSIQDLPTDAQYGTENSTTAQYATAWKVLEGSGDAKTILVSQAFSRPGMTAADTAVATVTAAQGVPVETMRAENQAWWQDFLQKSYVSLPDPRSEQFFWLQIYRMGSGVREDGPMYDLHGPPYPWNNNIDANGIYQVRWPAIWWNWNQQAIYAPFYRANHARLGFSIDNDMFANRRGLEINADALGEEPPRYQIGDRGGRDLISRHISNTSGNLGWVLFNSWETYDSIRDEDHLANVLYPLMAGHLRYVDTRLIDRDGVYHLPHGSNPEMGGGPDLSYDIAPLRALCRNIIKAETRLESHDNLTARCQDILDNLVDYHVHPDDGIMISETRRYDQSHRHFSHIIGIYPIRDLHGTSEPERAALARQSVEHFDETLHPDAQSTNTWGGFATSGLYAMVDDTANAARLWQMSLDSLQRKSSMTHNYEASPVNDCAFFAMRVLMDLLVHSRDGQILIFPATPDDWEEAVFHDLRLTGAFLVSARREGGVTQWVRIKSEAGEPCVVRHTLPGPVNAAGERAFTVQDLGDGFVEIDLQAGEEALLYTGNTVPEVSLAPVEHTLETQPWGNPSAASGGDPVDPSIDLALIPGINGSNDAEFTVRDIDAHGDASVLLDMTITAVINNPNPDVDGHTFAGWGTKTQDGVDVLGFNDDDNSWHEWIDSRSGDDAAGDSRFNTEEVVITFAIDGEPAMVDLGPGGFTIFWHSGGGYLVNGNNFPGLGSRGTVTHFANSTGLQELTLSPDVSGATESTDVQTALAAVSLDIVGAALIPEPPLEINSALPTVQQGTLVDIPLEAVNGSGELTWTTDRQALPAELDLSADGRLRGYPLSAGEFDIAVSVEDSEGNTDSATLTLTVQAAPENLALLEGNVFSAQGADGAHPAEHAVDGQTATKWLDAQSSTWFEVTLPAALRAELTEYCLTSADDDPLRDPRSWTLAAGNAGDDWQVIDEQTNQSFAERLQQRTFSIQPPTQPFRRFRFTFQNNGGDQLQLAEIALKGTISGGPYSLLYAAAKGVPEAGLQPDADGDHDGLSLELESFFGGNPLLADADVLPHMMIEQDPEDENVRWFTVRFTQNAESGEVAAKISSDMRDWPPVDWDSPDAELNTSPPAAGEWLRQVEIRLRVGEGSGFLRVGPAMQTIQ